MIEKSQYPSPKYLETGKTFWDWSPAICVRGVGLDRMSTQFAIFHFAHNDTMLRI